MLSSTDLKLTSGLNKTVVTVHNPIEYLRRDQFSPTPRDTACPHPIGQAYQRVLRSGRASGGAPT